MQETTFRARAMVTRAAVAAVVGALCACTSQSDRAAKTPIAQPDQQRYEHAETRQLVGLVNEAARMVATEGEVAFPRFRAPGSRWRDEETYVFVIDLAGTMVVHPDQTMEGQNQLALKDVNGRPIIRGLLQAATAVPDKPHGWYHYEWPVPGGLMPRWKSSFVQLVTTPSGKRFVVGSGMYNERMERAFVEDMVRTAVAQLEARGEASFPLFHDPTGPFLAKDAYVFVVDPATGVELVNPAFPNLEGRKVIDVEDTQGKPLVRELLGVVRTRGSGWVDYMWPKPGDSVSTRKSTYAMKANVGGRWLMVAAGVYLADAPKQVATTPKPSAEELMALVRQAASVLAQRGEDAFPEFRTKGSRWFHDDTYLIVWTMDGQRVLHAADPTLEGRDARGAKDVQGRPYGEMFLDVASSPSGEGWVHYMYPEPGDIFPAWKSVFVKRMTFPSGRQHLVASGVYNMELDRTFIVDLVDRASALIAAQGESAFAALRDKHGPFVFMDTYVFVDKPDGTEVVNPGTPFVEGKNLLAFTDVHGKQPIRDYIAAAMRDGTAWVEYTWYRPGDEEPTRKQTYVRRIQAGPDTYIVGAGLYVDE